MFFKQLSKPYFLLTLTIMISCFFHFYNFTNRLNFSMDQAKFSIKTLNLWENKEITLIGPSISFNIEGHEIFQGGVIYYFLLLFLLLGNLEPINASALFAFFSIIMAIPLYFGLKYLLSETKALALASVYLLLPILISYTSFLWNPNFQLSLIPIFFLFLGLYKQTSKNIFLILSGIWLGIILQFHYQLVIGVLIIMLWLKVIYKYSFVNLLIFFTSIIAGLTPMIIFELRNNFYNINTLIFFLRNLDKLSSSGQGIFVPHYYLSLILIILTLLFSAIKKFTHKYLFILLSLLVIFDLFTFLPQKSSGFGMAKNWYYQDEQKVFEIIKSQNLNHYNVANLEYDSLYNVQKYFHQKAGIENRLIDYWETPSLFAVIRSNEDPDEDPAYEIQVLKPYKIVNIWEINPYYNLYLLEKI